MLVFKNSTTSIILNNRKPLRIMTSELPYIILPENYLKVLIDIQQNTTRKFFPKSIKLIHFKYHCTW